MGRLIFRAFQCEMELDYIAVSSLLLVPTKKVCESIKNDLKAMELVSVNLSEFILAAVFAFCCLVYMTSKNLS